MNHVFVYSKKTMFAKLIVKEIKEYLISKNISLEKIPAFLICSDIKELEQTDKKTDSVLVFDCCEQKELELLYTELAGKWQKGNVLLINEFDYPDKQNGYVIIKNTEELLDKLQNILYSNKEENDVDFSTEVSLTNREKEILVLIAKGKLNKEIADELNITERTVKNHISNMFKKLDVYDRTQAAVYAIRNKLYTV